MKDFIKILILEDTESDVFLIERKLTNSSLYFESVQTNNKSDFIKKVNNYKPDIILSDYLLSNFTGIDALKIVLEQDVYIPFIIITEALDEETAVSCLKAGADDYLTKENLTRLIPSIRSAIKKRDILTDKEKTEKALRESEEKYRTLFENSEDAILILKNNIFVGCNDSSCKLFGYDNKNELLNTHPSDISPKNQSDGRSSFLKAEEMINIAVKKGVNRFEWLHKRKSDEIFFAEVLLTKIPFQDSYIIHSVVRDITEKKKAEGEIKQLAKELQTLIQTVNTPIFGVDVKGRISEWNLAAEEITGYTKTNALDRHFVEEFVHIDQKKTVKQIIGEAIKGSGITNFEILFKTLTGYRQLLLNSTTHRNSFEDVLGVIFVGQDITEIADYREELEQKIQERTKELRKALENEKELGELKSRFVSMASHEFRTPLSAIGFASGFLKKYGDRIDKEAVNKRLDKIDEQINHMTALLDDILTIGKAVGTTNFIPKTLKYAEFIKSILEEVKMVTKNSHEIRINKIDDSIKIELDPKLGRNIFINLLVNAIKFSPGADHILFENKIENNSLISKVIDFGIGIPEEDLPMVFTPFHRAKNTETIQGTGLGLPIVKEAVEVLNGTVSVESKKNKGTIFTVKIPMKQVN